VVLLLGCFVKGSNREKVGPILSTVSIRNI
jgi:hypothetical protein